FWLDGDGDGYGHADESVRACVAPTGYVSNAEDCDDSDASVHPGAPDDQCNGVDNNCDGVADSEAEQVTRYPDRDGDGWGVLEEEEQGCLPLDSEVSNGWVSQPGDCDDEDPWVYPGAAQRCDGKANPCEGEVDEGLRGTGPACPARSCDDVFHDSGGESADYWLADGEESYEAWCEMRADGGYTALTGKLVAEREWVSFSLVGLGSPDGAWSAGFEGDTFWLRPTRPSDFAGDACRTVVVRANLDLPFTFTAWEGSFEATHMGKDTVPAEWAHSMSGPPPCQGAVLFGAQNELPIKEGGEWGHNVELTTGRSEAWGWRELGRERSRITWEVNDFEVEGGGADSYLQVDELSILVR
ncbi:MAG: hypothetical protein EA397_07245, partial [Deltaproteobacteria bacterium]